MKAVQPDVLAASQDLRDRLEAAGRRARIQLQQVGASATAGHTAGRTQSATGDAKNPASSLERARAILREQVNVVHHGSPGWIQRSSRFLSDGWQRARQLRVVANPLLAAGAAVAIAGSAALIGAGQGRLDQQRIEAHAKQGLDVIVATVDHGLRTWPEHPMQPGEVAFDMTYDVDGKPVVTIQHLPHQGQPAGGCTIHITTQPSPESLRLAEERLPAASLEATRQAANRLEHTALAMMCIATLSREPGADDVPLGIWRDAAVQHMVDEQADQAVVDAPRGS